MAPPIPRWLVARRVPPPEVFAAVAREIGLLLGVDATYMARYEPDGTATGVAGWSAAGDAISNTEARAQVVCLVSLSGAHGVA